MGGQEKGDIEMGERAANRTNKMLDRISGMYVSKNIGYSSKYAECYERIFGKRDEQPTCHPESPASTASPAESIESTTDTRASGLSSWDEIDVEFGEGSLGVEILWTTLPVITATHAEG